MHSKIKLVSEFLFQSTKFETSSYTFGFQLIGFFRRSQKINNFDVFGLRLKRGMKGYQLHIYFRIFLSSKENEELEMIEVNMMRESDF